MEHYTNNAVEHYTINAVKHYAINAVEHYTNNAVEHYTNNAVEHYTINAALHHTHAAVRPHALPHSSYRSIGTSDAACFLLMGPAAQTLIKQQKIFPKISKRKFALRDQIYASPTILLLIIIVESRTISLLVMVGRN